MKPPERPRPAGPRLLALLHAASRDHADLSLHAFDEDLIRWAVETGLGPLLQRVTAQDPDAAASPLQPLVQSADLTARLLTAQHLDAMTEIIDACEGRVPPLVLLKGISICGQHYPEPHLRPMRDIDFLVEDHAVSAVESILAKLGYQQQSDKPAAHWDGHHHGAPFVHPETGVYVEAHRALFPLTSEFGSNGLFRLERVKTHLRPTEFRGRAVHRLSDELQVIYLACHWARALRLVGGVVPMMDVVYLLKNTPAVHWDHIVEWTAGSSAARHVYLLLTYLANHRLIDVAPEILRRLGQRPALGRIKSAIVHSMIDRYVVEGRAFGRLMTDSNFRRLWRVLVLGRPLAPVAHAVLRQTTHAFPRAVTRREGEREGEVMAMKTLRPEPPTIEAAPPPGAEDGRAGDGLGMHPRRRSGVRGRNVGGEFVVLDRSRQVIHQLNPTASYIWDRCDGHHTVSDIARQLARTFDVDPATAEKDVATAVRQLVAVGLVENGARSSPIKR